MRRRYVQLLFLLQVFCATIQFATSLFWGGNSVAQDSLVKHLESDETQSFVRTFSEKIQHSLTSLRHWKSELAFVTNTVPEIGAQVHQVPPFRIAFRFLSRKPWAANKLLPSGGSWGALGPAEGGWIWKMGSCNFCPHSPPRSPPSVHNALLAHDLMSQTQL